MLATAGTQAITVTPRAAKMPDTVLRLLTPIPRVFRGNPRKVREKLQSSNVEVPNIGNAKT
jgi:hypothetical protein